VQLLQGKAWKYGKTEFIARAGDRIIVIKEIPAYVCRKVAVRRISHPKFPVKLMK
jgi:hypothetical protein